MLVAPGEALGFGALVWVLGKYVLGRVMERIARTRSSKLFTLTVFVIALGVALIAAEVFHVSVALGAFFAGLVVGQSRFGAQANADMVPFRDVFTALFFVSMGMLFDASLLVREQLAVVLALVIVLVVKRAIALLLGMALRQPLRTALTVAVGLAQIGEFSFILAVTMRVCRAIRQLNARAVLITPADNAPARAWLSEFGVNHVVDNTEELARALLRAVRLAL